MQAAALKDTIQPMAVEEEVVAVVVVVVVTAVLRSRTTPALAPLRAAMKAAQQAVDRMPVLPAAASSMEAAKEAEALVLERLLL